VLTQQQTMAMLAIIILAASLTGIVIATNNFLNKLHDIDMKKARIQAELGDYNDNGK